MTGIQKIHIVAEVITFLKIFIRNGIQPASPGWHDQYLTISVRSILKNIPTGKTCIDNFVRLIAKIINDRLFFLIGGYYKEVAAATHTFAVKGINSFQGDNAVLKKDEFLLAQIAVENTVTTLHCIGVVSGVRADNQISSLCIDHVSDGHKIDHILFVRIYFIMIRRIF